MLAEGSDAEGEGTYTAVVTAPLHVIGSVGWAAAIRVASVRNRDTLRGNILRQCVVKL